MAVIAQISISYQKKRTDRAHWTQKKFKLRRTLIGSRVIAAFDFARKTLHKNHACPFFNLHNQMY